MYGVETPIYSLNFCTEFLTFSPVDIASSCPRGTKQRNCKMVGITPCPPYTTDLSACQR